MEKKTLDIFDAINTVTEQFNINKMTGIGWNALTHHIHTRTRTHTHSHIRVSFHK